MIGQKKLLGTIDSFTLSTLPRTIMLCGASGSGRHTICSYIATKFGLELIDITEKISLDTIVEAMQQVEPHLYIVDMDNVSEKEQNVILKFLEEPLKNSYIILIVGNRFKLLQTIQNRCIVWHMDLYSTVELSTFFDGVDSNRVEILKHITYTPGKIIEYKSQPIVEMYELANKMYDNIGKATLPNTLTLVDKIAFKNEKDKFSLNAFLDVLDYVVYQKFADHKISYDISGLSRKMIQDMYRYPNVNKEYLFANFLINLREAMRAK